MILYHVSTELDKDNYFYPRQPGRIMKNESFFIDRVCAAPRIEDCLSGMPRGGSRLDELNDEQAGFYKVFRIDTEKIGIKQSDIMAWRNLFEEGFVPDAEWTEEHWIVVPFTVPDEDVFIIHLTNWREDVRDIIPYTIYGLADEKYEGDYCRAYMEVNQEMVPCMHVITDPVYKVNYYKTGEEIRLFGVGDADEFYTDLIQVLQEKSDVSLTYSGNESLLMESGNLPHELVVECINQVKTKRILQEQDEQLAI